MESLQFEYRGGRLTRGTQQPVLVGVVGSGNLEVLVEPADLGGGCRVDVTTAAVGFTAIWRAVLDDFFARHPLADVRVSVNDMGATPAVVALRLDQAIEDFEGAGR
jgi:malonate decarboxylase delta subunit